MYVKSGFLFFCWYPVTKNTSPFKLEGFNDVKFNNNKEL